MNVKLIGKLNIFALMIVICLAMLFSGFTYFNQVYADVQPQDVEVSNLEGKIDKDYSGDLSFNLKINRRVKQGEEIVLNLGYDKVDKNDDLKFYQPAYGEVSIKNNDGSKEIIGTAETYKKSIKIIFNKKAEKYDVIDVNLSVAKNFYDIDSWSATNSKTNTKNSILFNYER